ncbi:hypothetical protein ERJ75_000162200 [Trypanosoma vivax]|nr:hypothetical protein ERJ75_000162200 [Trypanosoma vivax]
MQPLACGNALRCKRALACNAALHGERSRRCPIVPDSREKNSPQNTDSKLPPPLRQQRLQRGIAHRQSAPTQVMRTSFQAWGRGLFEASWEQQWRPTATPRRRALSQWMLDCEPSGARGPHQVCGVLLSDAAPCDVFAVPAPEVYLQALLWRAKGGPVAPGKAASRQRSAHAGSTATRRNTPQNTEEATSNSLTRRCAAAVEHFRFKSHHRFYDQLRHSQCREEGEQAPHLTSSSLCPSPFRQIMCRCACAGRPLNAALCFHTKRLRSPHPNARRVFDRMCNFPCFS